MTGHDQLFERVYEQLHALAARKFRGQESVTLQPTALVHEVYVRLARTDAADFRGREHFLAVAATAMRQILVDHARRRNADKRGGGWTRVTLSGPLGAALGGAAADTVDAITLDELIGRLERLDARQARIVELRVIAGLTVAEVASALGVSVSTAEKDWRRARAWLRLELQRGP